MSKWQQVKLKDICTVTSSKRFHLSERTDIGIPFYCSKEIIKKESGEKITECDFIPTNIYNAIAEKYGVPQPGDILLTTRGSIGVPYLYKSGDCFYFADGNLTWLKNFNKLSLPHFLYYWFKSYIGFGKINAIAKGTAQKAVPIAEIKNIELELPPIEVQRKIADVLSAYDDLIENNRKQIKLLEESAQRLYKEWFIDLRFPGHETAPIINGIPEGWKLTNLGTLGAFVRGKTITKDQTCSGNIPVVAGGLTPAYYHNAHNTDVPVITVSGSGANAGFSNMYFQKIWASDCSYLEKSKTQGFFFVYCFLKSNQEMLDNLQKGSAQPHVYAKDINAIAFYKPQDDVLQNFEYKTSPLFEQIANLQTSIKKATETRDRLLPKLITGELEVK